MTPRFLFPARTVTKNPSVWIRHLNYFLHRASFTIYLQYTEFHVLSCYPVTLTWNILETWKPAWLYGFRTGCYRRSEDSTASLNTRRCISCSFLNTMDSTKNYGLLSCSSLPSLGQASTGRCWVRSSYSAWLAGGNVFCFSPIYLCSVSYWLHEQWQRSTITAKTIIHNLFQIHQKYPYVFSTSTGFGTRNRIAGLPLNSTALLIQKPLMDMKCFVIDDDVLLNSPSINHFSECVGFSAFIAEYFSATKYSFFACLHFFQGVALLLGFQHQTLLNNSTPNKDFLCWWHMEPVLK